MATATKSHYELLEVPETADAEAIRKAFMANAKVWHPDKAPEEERPTYEAKFKQLSNAYEVLSDPDERRQYDRELKYERVRIAAGGPRVTRNTGRPTGTYTSDWEPRTWHWDSTQVNPEPRPKPGVATRVVQGTGIAAVLAGLVVMLVTMLTIGLISAVLGAFVRPARRRW